MSEIQAPAPEQQIQEHEPRLRDTFESARIDLENARTTAAYLEENGHEVPGELKTDIEAKSDWVNYLSDRDFKDENEVVRRSNGTFKSPDVDTRDRKNEEKLYEISADSEHKDRTYAELTDSLIDAEEHGDKTMVDDINEAIIDKIADDAERNGFTEEQTDRLYDRVVTRMERQTEKVNEPETNGNDVDTMDDILNNIVEAASKVDREKYEQGSGDLEVKINDLVEAGNLSKEQADKVGEVVHKELRERLNSKDVEAMTGQEHDVSVDTEHTEQPINATEKVNEETPEENLEEEKGWKKLQAGAKGAAWYMKHPGAAARMAFTRLHQLPGKAMEKLSNVYKTEEGEIDKKKIVKHAIIGAAVAGSAITLALIARKMGADESLKDAADVVNGTPIDTNPAISPEAIPDTSVAPHIAEVVPQNPALGEQANVISEALGDIDIEKFSRPWGVASEVAEATGQTTREALSQGIEHYNAAHGTAFELTVKNGITLIADSTGHIVNKAEETGMKQAIINAAG